MTAPLKRYIVKNKTMFAASRAGLTAAVLIWLALSGCGEAPKEPEDTENVAVEAQALFCQSYAKCGDGSVASCYGYTTACSPGVDGCGGYAECDGVRTYCPPCPSPSCTATTPCPGGQYSLSCSSNHGDCMVDGNCTVTCDGVSHSCASRLNDARCFQ